MKTYLWKHISGRHYNCLIVFLGVPHAGDSSDVTLAFEDAQVIQLFFKEEIDKTYSVGSNSYMDAER